MHPSDEPFRIREIWPPGTVIKGDYQIQNKLGGGGFGSVYLAQHRFLGTTHVIKRLHEQFASDPEYVRKFVNEARSVRRLKGCVNVVEVEHMTQSEDGHLILVMEHITGGDLAGLLAARQLRIDEVIDYGRQIATGLQAAHAAGLVHRDIKPQNVMLSHDSTGVTVLKLIDFGIAADHLNHQQTSVMRGGSIGYAAPEQWVKAGKDLDGRTDLYSLGATLYHMLCGRMPYQSNDIGDWIEKVKAGPPVAPCQLRQDIPRPLSNLILELLSLRPEGRPADAATVIRRLGVIQSEKPHPPTLDDVPAKTILLQTVPAKPRAQWPVWVGVSGLAAALTVGAWFTLGGKGPPVKKETPPVVVTKPEPEPVPPIVIPAKKEDKQDPPKLEKKKEKKEDLPKPPVKKDTPPEPKPEPVIDHAKLGNAALNSGDYRTALGHFKSLADAKRLSAVQRAVEADLDERVTPMLDKGQYTEALRVADSWLREFPGSQRLQNLRAKIARAKDIQ